MSWFYDINWYIVLTFLLVIVTGCYAIFTYKILRESQKSRKVLERQASALEESNRLLNRQVEDMAGLGREIVRSTIQTTLHNINYWKSVNIVNLASQNALPARIELIPPDAQSALYHARRISPDGSVELSSAFDNLRSAQNELEILIRDRAKTTKFIEKHTKTTLDFISSAEADLNAARDYLREKE